MASPSWAIPFLLVLAWAKTSQGANPLVPHVGMADPHVHNFGGSRVYMYTTHDQNISISNKSCCTGPWRVWSSEDLVHWEPVSSFAGFSWEPAEKLHTEHLYWATDAAQRHGQFYWYVSVGGGSIAVLSAATPVGPWKDPLGRLLFNDTLGKSLQPPTGIRDPGVLADDDGRYYIVFGACSGEKQPDDSCYYAAELNEDMISYKQPRHLSVQGAMGPYGPGKADDKPFLHKMGDTYYLSWGCFYGTAKSPYGPYTYQGTFIHPALIAPAFRMNTTQEPWYKREDYADRHGSFLNLHGQWYFFCNDRSHSDALHYNVSGFVFRDTVAAYVHYYKNGTIAPLVIDATGVASHSFVHEPVLPVEHFFSIEGGEKVEAPDGGFELVGLKAGSNMSFLNVAGLHSRGLLQLRVSNGGTCAGEVAVHVEVMRSRALFAVCSVSPTGSWRTYVDVSCALKDELSEISAPQKMIVSFGGGCGSAEFAHLDHIAFTPYPEDVAWV